MALGASHFLPVNRVDKDLSWRERDRLLGDCHMKTLTADALVAG